MRKHSALLLLMAPVIGIGSSALVAGSAGTAGATAKKASPTITICAAVPGAFRFAVNGVPVSFKAQCGVVKAKIGINHVTEISSPTLYRTLASISVSPATARVSASLRTATANLKLAANQAATVRFVNSKLVVQVPTLPTTPPSNPPVVNPPVGSAPPGSPPPGNPPVAAPDPVALPTGDGYIEICKQAADNMVEGTFPFTITAGTAAPVTYSLALVPVKANPLGSVPGGIAAEVCTGPIQVQAGTVTVAEGSELPSYSLESVTSTPPGSLGTVNLVTQTASVTVTAPNETTVTFLNYTNLNSIKVCKILVNNLGALAGTTFAYNVAWTFSPVNGATPISSNEPVYVTAVAASGEICSPSGVIPAGSAAVVTEVGSNPTSYVSVSNVDVVPVGWNDGTTATSTAAQLWVPPVGGGWADAEFTNDPMGFVEVCKYFDAGIPGLSNPGVSFLSDEYNAHNWATFTVNGGASFAVQGGKCSGPIEVPAGTATISEASLPNFYLESVTAVSVVGLPNSELQSGPSVDPAVVTVPYGSVGNETLVSFTDAVDPTVWKICLQETSPDANLGGLTATFGATFASPLVADDSTQYGGPALSLTIDPTAPTGLYCTGPIYGPPVVDPWGHPYMLTISQKTAAGVSGTVTVTGIVYQGNGSAGSPTLGVPPADGITVTAGAGVNVVTFTDGRTPPA